MQDLTRFLSEEDGLETVEYAIMTGAIIVATIGVLTLIGSWVAGVFTSVQTQLP